MIYTLTGPVGSGKSYYAVKLMLDSLKRKNVLTNLAVYPEILKREFAKQNKRETKFNVTQFRHPYPRNRKTFDEHDREYTEYEYFFYPPDGAQFPVVDTDIYIDESSLWFPSGMRIDQHEKLDMALNLSRKANTDIYFINPVEDNLCKQIRDKAEIHYRLQNLGNRKFFMFINGPPIRTCSMYVTKARKPDNIDYFTIKSNIIKCYDTTAGTFGIDQVKNSDGDIESNNGKSRRNLLQSTISLTIIIVLIGGVLRYTTNKAKGMFGNDNQENSTSTTFDNTRFSDILLLSSETLTGSDGKEQLYQYKETVWKYADNGKDVEIVGRWTPDRYIDLRATDGRKW